MKIVRNWSLLTLMMLTTSLLHATNRFVNSFKSYDQLMLVVVLMVKDEEPVIKPTLESYVAGLSEEQKSALGFFVFDTGSTDKTIEKAEEFFIENGISNAAIAQEPFVDFATSRNRGLELAEEKFPNAVFLMMPDAEWYMVNMPALMDFCQEHKENVIESSYLVRIMNPSIDFYTQRLLRKSAQLRFGGVVHETIIEGTPYRVPGEIYFDLRPSKTGNDKSMARWKRDLDLLLKHHNEHPNDPRTTFYLAQTYACLGDLENAHKYYKHRSTLAGWYEENFVTWYRLAQITEWLAQKSENGEYTWSQALEYYLKAYSYRSCRTEPLVRIAQHYLAKGEHALAYLFGHRACEQPYPINDVLFVDKNVYDFERHDVVGISSWYIGEYDMGEKGVRCALENRPEMEHLKKNLKFYEDRKALIAQQQTQIAAAAA